jgi:hypothetical protein
MPKIRPPRSAAVYAPDLPGAQDAFLPLLTDRRLFVHDTRTESLADLALPVGRRPVLRLFLLHAKIGEEYGAAVFVTDSLGTIGDSEAEQIAVVGALLHLGCEVVVGGEDLDSRWYQPRVRALGFNAVAKVMDELLGALTVVWERWPPDGDAAGLTILPTSVTLTYRDARLRVKELIELDKVPVGQIPTRLMAEGHVNARDRRIWYPKAVRQALEKGL